MIIGVLPLRK